MSSVRAKSCGHASFSKKKSEGSFLKLLVANRPCKITHLIYLYNIMSMNYNKFSKTSMYIFISPKISKSIFVEEEEGDLSVMLRFRICLFFEKVVILLYMYYFSNVTTMVRNENKFFLRLLFRKSQDHTHFSTVSD